jgi:hypothetical protein
VLKATVESTFDSGDPKTLRDGDGGLWRIAANPVDGTVAVEEVHENGETVVGEKPCGIAEWAADDTLVITRAGSHGENHTDPAQYEDGSDILVAGPNGWKTSAGNE